MALENQARATVRMGGDRSKMHTGTTGFHFSARESNGKANPEVGYLRLLTKSQYLKALVKRLVRDEKWQVRTVAQSQNPPQERAIRKNSTRPCAFVISTCTGT